MDVKKLGRITDGGGWRADGRSTGVQQKAFRHCRFRIRPLCAVDVGGETVVVCFCCSGGEVGDGPGPVDDFGGEVEFCDAALVGESGSCDDGADVVDVARVCVLLAVLSG